jgi:hypothetical protein
MSLDQNSEEFKNLRTIMNKGDILGIFDEYLEEKKIYEQCDSYDDIIHKIIELHDQKKTPSQILVEVIVFMDDEFDFHPDKDLEGEELSDMWREDMLELISEIVD